MEQMKKTSPKSPKRSKNVFALRGFLGGERKKSFYV